MTEQQPGLFPLQEHNHQNCIDSALAAADEICRKQGIRLTALRRRVLELVWGSHKPIGAYDLLERLQAEGKAAPPTVYRALEFLQQAGLVHRLATLNAYVGCARPEHSHHGPFLICRSCRTLVELAADKVSHTIAACSAAAGFTVIDQTVEIHGLCQNCLEENRHD